MSGSQTTIHISLSERPGIPLLQEKVQNLPKNTKTSAVWSNVQHFSKSASALFFKASSRLSGI